MRILSYIKIYFLLWVLLTSCDRKNTVKKTYETSQEKELVKYAKGFDIRYYENYKELIVNTPFLNSSDTIVYRIYTKLKGAVLYDRMPNEIHVPVNRIVLTSTTHIPMVELLENENSIVGFPNTRYVSSDKTRALIDSGKITELGKEAELNTEILIDIHPEIVVGFSVYGNDTSYDIIKKADIPVILNGDWLEDTPLGRAEWIKFFGVLFDKTREADSIFRKIEQDYIAAKAIANNATKQPTVLSGSVMNKDIWNLPAGDSFVARYLADANLSYLWKNTKGKGSLSLSFESVFDKGQTAEYWIAPGYFSTKKQLLDSNPLYGSFAAFKNDHIYTPTTKKGKTGGVIYYELAPTRPDLVLKDIIKITKPDLLPNYRLTFFEKMK
ncbi:MAG: ABC transporter substrate-binding protein [Flavobacteriaceae bacterium]|nr:MAG: ABC transporter substrate-binding protein [Flavobacteriaceae bacterium]